MDANLWNAYLELQTGHAYPDGLMPGSPYSQQLAGAFVSYFSLAHPTLTRGLVIGPGGFPELHVIAGQFAIKAVTIFEPEREDLASRGYDIRYGDIHDLPFPSESFEFVYSSNVMEHVLSPYIALMECRRVLKTGGCAVHVMPQFQGPFGGVAQCHLHCLDEKVWTELLRKCGFEIESTWSACYDGTHTYQTYVCKARELPQPHSHVLRKLREMKP